jgi:hypothetical protein
VSDEQRVRTMAGWIGVEISRSRVRTPGKAGYGLYRVRGSVAGPKRVSGGFGDGRYRVSEHRPSEWTAYAFTLEEIETEIEVAIGAGRPEGPSALMLRPAGGGLCGLVTVPTRWTSGYQGSRTLGGGGAGPALDEVARRETVRSRQRAQNAEFQAVHKVARDYGLKKRHAAKLARKEGS